MSFDLSSDSSSDSSVVDISALLPAISDSNVNNGTKKLFHILGDEAGNDDQHPSDVSIHMNHEESKGSIQNSASTEAMNSGASSKDARDKDDTIQDDERAIQMVMGESVKTWRSQKHVSGKTEMKASEHTNASKKGNFHIPRFAMVNRNEPLSDPNSNHNTNQSQIGFMTSSLEIQRNVNGNDIMSIVMDSSKEHNPEDKDDSDCLQTFQVRKFKRQLLHERASSSPAQISTPGFVDCVAFWDPYKEAYVLEVPELVANDAIIVPSFRVDKLESTGFPHGPTNQNGTARQSKDAHQNSSLRRQDPLEQQRNAEMKLQKQRKRRRV